jgi:glycine/sarcosine N-methyltransferase
MNKKTKFGIKEDQDFGQDPQKMRESDHYKHEYVSKFVENWDALIGWDQRTESEGDFFIDLLKSRGAKRVLDVACGTGYHSVRLREAGFDVVSADGSPEMLAKAFENGRKRGHILRTVQADWRWLSKDVHEQFDAVICLGNSFTHLFHERDRRKSLAEFYSRLFHDGILILDQRNYDALLNNEYKNTHTYYYCGENISAQPEHVDEGLARFKYTFPGDEVFHLNMFPLRKAYMQNLMKEVGFQNVVTYADFTETHKNPNPDFYVHVADKVYLEEYEHYEPSSDDRQIVDSEK